MARYRERVFVLLPFCSRTVAFPAAFVDDDDAAAANVSLTYFSIIHCSLVYVNAFIK